jgi:hypothetical protein
MLKGFTRKGYAGPSTPHGRCAQSRSIREKKGRRALQSSLLYQVYNCRRYQVSKDFSGSIARRAKARSHTLPHHASLKRLFVSRRTSDLQGKGLFRGSRCRSDASGCGQHHQTRWSHCHFQIQGSYRNGTADGKVEHQVLCVVVRRIHSACLHLVSR